MIRRAALKDLPGAHNTDGLIKLNKVQGPKRLPRLDLLQANMLRGKVRQLWKAEQQTASQLCGRWCSETEWETDRD